MLCSLCFLSFFTCFFFLREYLFTKQTQGWQDFWKKKIIFKITNLINDFLKPQFPAYVIFQPLLTVTKKMFIQHVFFFSKSLKQKLQSRFLFLFCRLYIIQCVSLWRERSESSTSDKRDETKKNFFFCFFRHISNFIFGTLIWLLLFIIKKMRQFFLFRLLHHHHHHQWGGNKAKSESGREIYASFYKFFLLHSRECKKHTQLCKMRKQLYLLLRRLDFFMTLRCVCEELSSTEA